LPSIDQLSRKSPSTPTIIDEGSYIIAIPYASVELSSRQSLMPKV
jgi:hypothetical protein